MSDAQGKKFDVLVVHAVDRLYRDLRGLLSALHRLERVGVSFLSITEGLDFTSSWGKLTLAVLGSLAEIYVDKLSTEVRKGKKQRASQGLSNAGTVPIGYDYGTPFTVNPETSKGVIRCFKLYASGNYSYATLAAKLNREGYPTNQGRWTLNGVGNILQSRFYTGQVQYRDTWYKGNHEGIISESLFEQVQRIRQQRALKQRREPIEWEYLCKSLLVCSCCGQLLHCQTTGQKYQYYVDSANRRSIECDSYGKRVRVEIIDSQVESLIKCLELPSDWQESIVQLANHKREKDTITQQRQAIERKLEKLKFLFVESDLTEKQYKRKKAKLQAELSTLQVPEQVAIIEAGKYLQDLGVLWNLATLTQQRELLQGMLKSIRVDLETNLVVCLEPFAEFRGIFRQVRGLKEDEKNCFHQEKTAKS